jgi:hypothetical protein
MALCANARARFKKRGKKNRVSPLRLSVTAKRFLRLNKNTMKKIIFLLLTITPLFINAQQSPGTIYPGNSFTNYSSDTLFYLSKQKLEILMDREEISAALIQSLTARNAESDSLLSLKILEAEGWYSKLLETDKLLEESELIMVQEQHKARKKSKIWFGVGTLAGLIVGLVL